MRSTLVRRITKLEAATAGSELTWGECVFWSYQPDELRVMSNREYRLYRERYARSRIARLFYEAEAQYNERNGIKRPANTWIAA